MSLPIIEITSTPRQNVLLRKQLMFKIGFALVSMLAFFSYIAYELRRFTSYNLEIWGISLIFATFYSIYNYFAYGNQPITYSLSQSSLNIGEKNSWIKGTATWKGIYRYIKKLEYSDKYMGIIIFTNYPSLFQTNTFSLSGFVFTPNYANLFIPIEKEEDKIKFLEFLQSKIKSNTQI